MKKIADFLIKKKNIILLAIGVLTAIAIVGTVFLVLQENKINSDMISYLSDDFDTQKGLDFITSNFGVRGDVMIVVRGSDDDAELRKSVEEIKKIDGVNKLIWAEDANTLDEIKNKIEDIKLQVGDVDEKEIISLIEETPLLSSYSSYIKLLGIKDLAIDTSELRDFLKRPIGDTDEYDYVMMLMLKTAPSASESYSITEQIRNELAPRPIAVSGSTETARVLMNDTLADLPIFLVFGILAAVIILLLATSSFMDPVIILLTLGVGIIISMGANYLYPSISVISFATSAVLQLAITIDYSVFYMHAYKRNRVLLDATEALKKTLPESASAILASGFTTVGGFIALYCMRFKLGTDLANVLIKGVILSIITILVLQPVLTLIFDKAIQKTSHDFIGKLEEKIKRTKPRFKGIKSTDIVTPIAKFSVFSRIVLIILAVALLVPSFIGQMHLKYSYLKMYDSPDDSIEAVLAEELGNQTIMVVPLKTLKGTQKEFIEKLKNDPNGKITGVTGAFSTIDIDNDTLVAVLEIFSDEDALKDMEKTFETLPSMLKDDAVRAALESQGVDVAAIEAGLSKIDFDNFDIKALTRNLDLSAINTYFSKVNGKWYTIYTLNISGSAEDSSAMETYSYLVDVKKDYFGNDGYSIGMLTGSHDLAQTTPHDFMLVTIVSAAIIFLIITILLRNPLKSLIIVAIIELGIWINLSITMLLGENLNFMVYIIISSVELGCTVDYAILAANAFERNREECKTGKECAVKSATETIPAIFVSATIIIAICTAVNLVSKNLVIKQLTGMLARGAAISFVLVAFVQTAIMSLFKTERKKIDYAQKLKELEAKNEKTQK